MLVKSRAFCKEVLNMRIALYERVSSEEQALHGYSLVAQDTALNDFAKNKGYTIVDTYRDEGISAHKPYTARPELLRLLADCEKGKIDLIIFVKLDRWFRNVKEYYKVQEILERNNVCWQAILEDYETVTANGRFVVTLMLAIAQQEAERTSERLKFVFQNKIQNGQPVTGTYGFGYKAITQNGTKTVIKDENEQAVNAMFEYFLRVGNISQLTDYMRDNFGMVNACNTWSRRLKNIHYTGQAHGIDNFLPAYITMQQHNAIIDIIANRRTRRSEKRTYLFSGLIVCPVCGRKYSGATNTRYNALYYRCGKAWNKGGCTNKKVWYETAIERQLLATLQKQAEIDIEHHQSKTVQSPQKYQEQLNRLNDMYLMGNIEKSKYELKSKELKSKIAQIEAENSTVGQTPRALTNLLKIDLQKAYAELDRQGKQLFWRSVLSEITFNGTEIKFSFKFY